jgi:hypothetical protein
MERKDIKILYYDEDVIVAEDQSGEKVIFYPYCGGCHSGFWFLQTEKLTRETFDELSLAIQEKLKKLGFAP